MTTIAMVGSVVNHGSGLEIATQTEDVEISWNFYTNHHGGWTKNVRK
jgi:hypothetical protein